MGAAKSAGQDAGQGADTVPRVFISYRRADSRMWVKHIDAALAAAMGEGAVFCDMRSIPPGVDFEAEVTRRLSDAHVMLLVIGQVWAVMEGAGGKRRLDGRGDLLRREIELALQKGLHIMPVLVNNARMPTARQLPESIRALARLQAVELSDKHFETDVADLVDRLKRTRVVLKGEAPDVDPGTSARVAGTPAPPVAAPPVAPPATGASPWAGAAQPRLLQALEQRADEVSAQHVEAYQMDTVEVSLRDGRWHFDCFPYQGTKCVGDSVVGPSVLADLLAQVERGPLALQHYVDLGEALFQLLVPKSVREPIAASKALLFRLDEAAEKLPWEFLKSKSQALPLGLSASLLRTTLADRARRPIWSDDERDVLVLVGTLDAPLFDLPGVRREAEAVESLLAGAGFKARRLADLSALQAIQAVALGNNRVVHLTGHGVRDWSPTGPAAASSGQTLTGLVLDGRTALTVDEILAQDRCPEMVTVGAQHLALWAPPLIRAGCEAVVASDIPMDDEHAERLLRAFFITMCNGWGFFNAAGRARVDTARLHPDAGFGAALAMRFYGRAGYRLVAGAGDASR